MGSLVSIDIGKKNLHIVEGSYLKGIVQIDRAIEYPMPEGCFNGEIIQNAATISEALVEGLRKAGISSREAVLTINASSAMIRDIDLPVAKPKEIDEMIKNELVQTYHALSTDVVQYKQVDKVVNDSGQQLIRYRATAIDQEIIEDYHSVLLQAKLKPLAMDINVNSIDKLIAGDITVNDKILNGNATMLLDLGDTITTIYIVSHGKPVFYRHLNSGSGEIEKYIYDETFISEKDIRKQKEEGFNLFGDDETAMKYYGILRPYFYNFTDEIRKVIGFYTSRANAGNVEQIFLFGGGSKLTGFTGYCESNFNIPTELVNNISRIKAKDPAFSVGVFMNAAGALIRY